MKHTPYRSLLLACVGMYCLLLSSANAVAQCEWTYYADSLRQVIFGSPTTMRVTGMFSLDVDKEYIDSNGTKHIYYISKVGASPYPVMISADGEVYALNEDYGKIVHFRLCDTVGSMFRLGYKEVDDDWKMYMGIYPFYALGKTRPCKVFITLASLNDSLIPTDIEYLADSLGVVATVAYEHQWQRQEVIGIWFGNRYVGNQIVGVEKEVPQQNGIHLRSSNGALFVDGIAEGDNQQLVTVHVYDIYGRALLKQQLTLEKTSPILLPHHVPASGSVLAWVIELQDGRVVRGVTMSSY